MTSPGEGTQHKACLNCGTELPFDARFCLSCGASQTPRLCDNCGADLAPGARFCMSCGTPSAIDAEQKTKPREVAPTPAPSTSRRVTSVLFADLVGFTTLAESRDHEDVRELLTHYFDRTRTIVARYGGTLEKFIGDAVMAVWGVPTAHEDDAERAVRAGLEIIDAVALVRDEVGLATLDVRVGVVTGEVTVAIGATGQGMIAGDAVNTASRVQSVATPGQVWVDETTRLLTHSAITYDATGSHHLKGKQDSTPLWAAQAVVANVGGAQRADGLEAPLIGRHRELRLIKELFHRTEETLQPAMLVVSSDPGLGKTRLGWEFSKYADGLSGSVRWLEGRCVAYGESVAFYALAEAIRGRLWSLRPARDLELGSDDLAELLDLGLDLFVKDPDERDWIRPRLAVLLLSSERSFEQQDLFRAWISFLSGLAHESTAVVLLIDDAEHADDGFLAFLDQALQTDDLPLYVLLLARHELVEGKPQIASNRRTTVLHLSPLAPAEMSGLVTGLVRGLPDDVRDGLVRRADGVPLFAMETVRSMIDRDMVVPRGGQYVLADGGVDLDAIGAPASLHALVASRLDALGATERAVVDSASVLGQGFTREILVALHPEPEDDLTTALDALVRRQILSLDTNPLGGDFGRYGFVQDVVRQVAYNMLARRDRRAAHLRVADHFGEGSGELASLVARHLIGAAEAVPTAPDVSELRLRARDLLVSVSLRTLGRGTATGAIDQLTAAIELSHDDVERARVETVLARAHGTERQFTAQIEVSTRALKVLDAAGDREGAAMAASHLAFAYIQTGRVEESIEILQTHWDELAELGGSDDAVCLIGRYLLLALHHAGHFDEVMPIALPAMRAAERTGDDLAVLRILEIMAYTTRSMQLPRLTTALVDLLAATTAERGLDSTDISAMCIRAIHLMWHDLPAALLEIDTLDLHIKRHRLVSHHGWMTLERLLVDLTSGRWDDLDAAYTAFADLAEPLELDTYHYIGLRISEARDSTPPPARPTDTVANFDKAPPGGLLLQAVQVVRSGAKDADARGIELLVQSARRGQSIHASEGLLLFADCLDLAETIGSADAVRELLSMLPASDTDHSVEIAVRAHRARTRAVLARLEHDEPTKVQGHLREAIAAYDTWGGRLWARRCEVELAALLQADGQAEEATALLTTAREFYQLIGATAWQTTLDDPSDLPLISQRGGQL